MWTIEPQANYFGLYQDTTFCGRLTGSKARCREIVRMLNAASFPDENMLQAGIHATSTQCIVSLVSNQEHLFYEVIDFRTPQKMESLTQFLQKTLQYVVDALRI